MCFGTCICVCVCICAWVHMFIYVFSPFILHTKNIINLEPLIAMKVTILVIIEYKLVTMLNTDKTISAHRIFVLRI